MTDASLLPLLSPMASLTWLDLTRVEGMTDDTLVTVGGSCARLQTLLLFSSAQLTDIGVVAIARGCPLLSTLDCTGLRLLTDQSLFALSLHCHALHTLTLQWCIALTDASLQALGEERQTHLRHLSLHGCRLLTLNGLKALARGSVGRSLFSIDLNGCHLIPHRDKRLLHDLFPQLTTIASL